MWPTSYKAVAYAEGQFDVIARPMPHPLEPEGALPFHPKQFWTAVGAYDRDHDTAKLTGTSRTLTVMNRGLPEYELLGDPETLVRLN